MYTSYPVGEFQLIFTYSDGSPTSAEVSVDGGVAKPAKISTNKKNTITSAWLAFPSKGLHSCSITVVDANGPDTVNQPFVVDLLVNSVNVEFDPP